jgi:hypothetical protein
MFWENTLFLNCKIEPPKKPFVWCAPQKIQIVKQLGIYLLRKLISLFCFVLYRWDPPNQDASDHILGLFGKLLRRRGASAWFHGVWICGAKVSWILNDFFAKNNYIIAEFFWRIGMCLWRCWKDLVEQDSIEFNY